MKKQNTNSKNSIKTPSRKLILDAMDLWEIYGANYATCVDSYRALLQRKRDLKIAPLGKIPESTIRELPEIAFLKISKSKDALAYLEKLSAVEVEKLIHHITYMVRYDHAYRMINTTIKEYDYQIRAYGKRNRYSGVNPDCIGTGRGTKSRTNGRNVRIDETK